MENESKSNGIGLSGAVFLVFLVLKLTGQIDWSWWYVTMPLYAPIPFAVLGVILKQRADKKAIDALDAYRKSYQNETLKESKFMQKLREAREASERARKVKEN